MNCNAWLPKRSRIVAMRCLQIMIFDIKYSYLLFF
nr:MAG TPA: hypothetical protein [Siphoviridae sp. ctEy724]